MNSKQRALLKVACAKQLEATGIDLSGYRAVAHYDPKWDTASVKFTPTNRGASIYTVYVADYFKHKKDVAAEAGATP